MYTVTNASKDEMDFMISLAKNEGWNPGLADGRLFYEADPKGFFIGKLKGEPISCISAVKYGDFGFVGLYIVRPQYRAQGYGLPLWRKAMDYLGDINIGLDGVPAQVENYQKSGFQSCHGSWRFAGEIPVKENGSGHIVPADESYLRQIIAYDALHFPGNRGEFLKGWFGSEGHHALLRLEDNSIRGMGVIRKCYEGYKIGPLFADTPEIGESLLLALARYAQGETVYFDIIEGHVNAQKLVQKYQMKKMFECARMYTKERPAVKWDNVYGITTFELG